MFLEMYLLFPVLLYGLIKCIISLKALGVSEQNRPKSPNSPSQLARLFWVLMLQCMRQEIIQTLGEICFSRTIILQFLSFTVPQAFLCWIFIVIDPTARDCCELCSISGLRHLIEQGLCYTCRASTVSVPPCVTQELNHSLRQINDKCRTQTRAKGGVR